MTAIHIIELDTPKLLPFAVEMRVRHKPGSNTRRPLARLFAYFLLVGIIYSAAFGAVHSHTDLSTAPVAKISADFAGQTGFLSEGPLQNRSYGQECLICVLHRQFLSTTVHTPVFVIGPSSELELAPAPVAFHYSSAFLSPPIARQSGRAPPRKA